MARLTFLIRRTELRKEREKKKGGSSSCVTFALEQESERQVGPGCLSKIFTWIGHSFPDLLQISSSSDLRG